MDERIFGCIDVAHPWTANTDFVNSIWFEAAPSFCDAPYLRIIGKGRPLAREAHRDCSIGGFHLD